jgi:predicted metal-dependent phosphoesterase TrpH
MILDLHNHTRWSFDCSMDPAKVVRVAKARGVDAIAITDHDEIEGAREALKAAGGDVLVILGEEIDTAAGDVLGLFLRERIVERNPIEAIRAIHEQGGLAVLAHPFTKSGSVGEDVARALDGCEGFNARHSEPSSYEGADGEPRVAAFAKTYDLSLTAGSDAHFYRELARAKTIVSASSLDEAKEQIRRGNTVLSGRRSSPFNVLASAALRSMKSLIHPEPE